MRIAVDYFVGAAVQTDILDAEGKIIVQIARGRRGRVKLPNGDVHLYAKVIRIVREAD